MKPFILVQHDKDRAQLKELRESEIRLISAGQRPGGTDTTATPQQPVGTTQRPIKLNTVTVTPDGDGGDDGADEG